MNTLQLVIIIAIFVAPAIKQIYDKAKEKAEVEKRKREQERVRTESLRTGITAERMPQMQRQQQVQQRRQQPIRQQMTVQTDRTRLQQLEAEREKRLRELRRVAQQRSRGGAQQQQRQQRQQQRRPVQQQQRTPQQVRQRQPTPIQRQRASTKPVASTDLTGAPAPIERSAYDIAGPVSYGGLRSLTSVSGGVGRAGNASLGTLTRQSLRRAIVLNELLGPPVAVREGHLSERTDRT